MSDAALSLRDRLLRALFLPLVILLTISGIASYEIALRFSNSVYDGWLYDSVNSLAQTLETTDARTQLNLPASAQRLFEWDIEDRTYFKVTDSHGLIGGREDLPPVPADGTSYRNATMYDAMLDGSSVRVVALSVERQAGRVLLEVAETQGKRRGLARQILVALLIPQVTLLLACAVVVWFGIRSGLSPLHAIAERLREQNPRTLQRMPESGAPKEIRSLIHALNELLDRLEQSVGAQRAFVANAAHQLRTPLTTLTLQIDDALANPTLTGAHEAMERAQVSTTRLVRLSNQLLSLAKTEPDAALAHAMDSIDLATLARETGAEWVPQALAKRIELSFDADSSPIRAMGNTDLLREALNNLLDNAIKHHPGNGHVQLSVIEDQGPVIRVEDDGRGIPPDQRSKVFQRFHRGDRSAAHGAGLGLAIVSEIVTLHGGTIVLSDGQDGRGLRVDLRLRTSSPAV